MLFVAIDTNIGNSLWLLYTPKGSPLEIFSLVMSTYSGPKISRRKFGSYFAERMPIKQKTTKKIKEYNSCFWYFLNNTGSSNVQNKMNRLLFSLIVLEIDGFRVETSR